MIENIGYTSEVTEKSYGEEISNDCLLYYINKESKKDQLYKEQYKCIWSIYSYVLLRKN